MKLTYRDLLKCFGRTYLVGANFNTRGLQNIGLAYAMDPGLKAIYSSGAALQAARARYVRLYNTHPYFTPLLVGAFLFLEKNIAQGVLHSTVQESFQSTASYTLSALGDSFFGGSLLVFWSLCMTILLLSGWYWLAGAWLCVCFLGLQLFKALTFWLGLSKGLAFFQRLRQMNLMRWGHWIKLVNAGGILFLWWLMFPFPRDPLWFAGISALLGGASWLVFRGLLPREVAVVAYLFIWGVWAGLKTMG